MHTPDTCCTLVPYFTIKPGQIDAFKALVPKFLEKTRTEPGCLHYAFSFHDHTAHCREGYDNAAAILAHLDNVGPILEQALQHADLTRLEIHAPKEELDQLREPLAALKPQFFELAPHGIRRTKNT